MKFLAIVFAASLFAVGCGDASTQDKSDPVQVNTTTAALGSVITWGQVTAGFIQQVPISCAPTACTDGNYLNYTVYYFPDAFPNTKETFKSQFYANSSWLMNSGKVAQAPNIRFANGIYGDNLTNWSVGYNNTAQSYFPAIWDLPGGSINYGLKSINVAVSDSGYAWGPRSGTGYVYYHTSGGGIGTAGPTTSTTYANVRIDVPFPEYGITNRFFYSFLQ